MKYTGLLFFLFPLTVSAQETAVPNCKLVKETDPYTKETRLSSGFISLQGGSLTIDADSKELDFFFVVPDKCFANDATVFIYFEGNRNKISYRNTGSMNCDGYFHFIFRNGTATPAVLQRMATQKVTSFVFTGNDKKAVTVSLLPDQQIMVQQITACMVAESKLLIRQ